MGILTLLKDGIGMLCRRPTMLEVGSPAPEFAVTAHNGSTVRLSELRGTKVVLWFYPKASTGG
jgi:peroxiredoxin Q/BCP